VTQNYNLFHTTALNCTGSSPSKAPQSTRGYAAPATANQDVAGCGDGYELASKALYRLGVKYMFGVVGIPVTPLASSAQVRACLGMAR
jgi:hypothetical protein